MRISDWSSDVCSSDLGFGCHVLRLLVGAQADEARVADRAAGGIFGEGDLGDKIGLYPMDLARRRPVDFDRRGLARAAREFRRERRHRIGVAAGSAIALVDELVLFALPRGPRGQGGGPRRTY